MIAETRATTVDTEMSVQTEPPLVAPVSQTMVDGGLKPEGLYEVLRLIQQSRAWAHLDQQTNGEDGIFAAAALQHRIYLDEAYDHLVYLNEWLETNGLVTPSITDAAVAFQIFGYLREAVTALGLARHWALLSASSHHSRAAARTYECSTEAQRRAEALSDAAGRAYLNVHEPLA